MIRIAAPLIAAGVLLGALPSRAAPAFKHIILIVQENRTPDNLFGSNPTFERGVDISAVGTVYGTSVPLVPFVMAACYDPDHSHSGWESEYTHGFQSEAFNVNPGCVVPSPGAFTYVDNSTGEVDPYFAIAEQYGFANRMFQTNQGPSFPAHLFLFSGTSAPSAESPLFVAENPILHEQPSGCIAPAGQTVRLIDGFGDESSNPPIVPCVDHRTLGDLFDAAGIDWRYYTPTPGSIWTAPDAFKHICGATIVNGHGVCQGQIWTAHVVANNPAQVLTDTANCDLAPLSWVIPDRAESDHATETDGSGPAWVASVVNAVGNQPTCPSGENYWQDTAIVITWDDWGGWFDHVPPPAVQVQPYSPAAWGDGYVYGFRVPMMVVSAYTPAGLVDNQMHDFGGILNFVEENFGLGTIGPGNSLYANYADFQARKRGDSLAGFFPLSTPRAFAPIPSPLPPSFFLDQKGPFYGPDGD